MTADTIVLAVLVALLAWLGGMGLAETIARVGAWYMRTVRRPAIEWPERSVHTPPRSAEVPDLPRPRLHDTMRTHYEQADAIRADALGEPRRPLDAVTLITTHPGRSLTAAQGYREPARVERDLVCPHCGGVAGRVIAQASDAAPGERAGVSSRTGRGV